jgi:hypothetical protein
MIASRTLFDSTVRPSPLPAGLPAPHVARRGRLTSAKILRSCVRNVKQGADVKWSGRPLRRNSCGYHRAGTATHELRRSQALSHTGSFGWNLPSQELVCSDETFRILEDDRSVNRRSISFERIHPEDLSSAGLTTIGSELAMSYARTPVRIQWKPPGRSCNF